MHSWVVRLASVRLLLGWDGTGRKLFERGIWFLMNGELLFDDR